MHTHEAMFICVQQQKPTVVFTVSLHTSLTNYCSICSRCYA